MANFIELKESSTNINLFINVDRIVFFARAPEDECTSIYVDKKNYLDVKERPEEIINLIHELEAEF